MRQHVKVVLTEGILVCRPGAGGSPGCFVDTPRLQVLVATASTPMDSAAFGAGNTPALEEVRLSCNRSWQITARREPDQTIESSREPLTKLLRAPSLRVCRPFLLSILSHPFRRHKRPRTCPPFRTHQQQFRTTSARRHAVVAA
jgi:hypothetical protein